MRRFKHRRVDPDEVSSAAIGVALGQGLHAVTTGAIAERLQVSERSVLATDPDEALLAAEAFGRIASAELAEIKRIVLAYPSPARQMTLLVEALAQPGRTEVDALWSDAWSLGRRNARLADAVREEEESWHQFIASTIRRGIRSGDFLPADPEAVAHQLMTTIGGATSRALLGYGSVQDRQRMVAGIVHAELGLRFEAAPESAPTA